MQNRKVVLILIVSTICLAALLCYVDGSINITTSPAPGGILGPMLYVNDQIYFYHADSQYHPPELDSSWTYIGTVLSQTSKWGALPVENFQENHALVKIGSEIYHSKEGSIYFNPEFGYEDEIFDDSIVVVSDGLYYQYIVKEASSIIIDRKNAFTESACLIVDNVKYQQKFSMSGDGFQLDNSYVFLGEVESVVPRTELPTENFQTNIAHINGGKIYSLPPEDQTIYDILVLVRGYSRVYFSEQR